MDAKQNIEKQSETARISAACATTSGATSSIASIGIGSHEATIQQSADGAEVLTAEDSQEARPPKESAVDPKFRHVEVVEVLDARDRFSHNESARGARPPKNNSSGLSNYYFSAAPLRMQRLGSVG